MFWNLINTGWAASTSNPWNHSSMLGHWWCHITCLVWRTTMVTMATNTYCSWNTRYSYKVCNLIHKNFMIVHILVNWIRDFVIWLAINLKYIVWFFLLRLTLPDVFEERLIQICWTQGYVINSCFWIRHLLYCLFHSVYQLLKWVSLAIHCSDQILCVIMLKNTKMKNNRFTQNPYFFFHLLQSMFIAPTTSSDLLCFNHLPLINQLTGQF